MRAQALTAAVAGVVLALAFAAPPAGASRGANGWIGVALWSESCGSMDCEELPAGVVLVRPDGGDARRVAPDQGDRPRFSADGRFLAVEVGWQGPGIAVGRPAAHRLRYVDRGDPEVGWPYRGMAWSPRSDELVFARTSYDEATLGETTMLVRLSVTTGQRLTLGTGSDPAWSPEGAWIAFSDWVDGARRVVVARRDGSDRRMLADVGDGAVYGWSADGRRVVFSNAYDDPGAALFAVDVATGAVTRVRAPRGRLGLLSPDGRLRVTATERGMYVARRDGSGRRRIMGPARRWGADGYVVCDWQAVGGRRRFETWRDRWGRGRLC